MYIRWVIRRHKNASTADIVFHDAYLVESYRDERGTPRQRMICYLGNIRQIDGEFLMIERELFVLRAKRILETSPTVPVEEHKPAVRLLRQKFPILTEDEVEAAFHTNLCWYAGWWREHGRALTHEELLKLIEGATSSIDKL
jgi:hypothetical protein